jgi:hypothetical protein
MNFPQNPVYLYGYIFNLPTWRWLHDDILNNVSNLPINNVMFCCEVIKLLKIILFIVSIVMIQSHKQSTLFNYGLDF